jgi:hypothetical protein
MTKEVSVAEILDMDDLVVSPKGYTRGELKIAFDKLTENLDNWKMPIHTNIHIGEWNLMIEACVFFTGSKLWQVKDLGQCMMEVKAEGYYKAMASCLPTTVVNLSKS